MLWYQIVSLVWLMSGQGHTVLNVNQVTIRTDSICRELVSLVLRGVRSVPVLLFARAVLLGVLWWWSMGSVSAIVLWIYTIRLLLVVVHHVKMYMPTVFLVRLRGSSQLVLTVQLAISNFPLWRALLPYDVISGLSVYSVYYAERMKSRQWLIENHKSLVYVMESLHAFL